MPHWLNVAGRYLPAPALEEETAETIWNRFGFAYDGWQAFHVIDGVLLSPLFPDDEREISSLPINYAASRLVSESSLALCEIRGTVLFLSSQEWEKLEGSIPVISYG